MTDVVIIISDTADPSSFVCFRQRAWFRRHNLDYDDYKKNGIPVSKLYATGDQVEMIKRLEKTARRRLGLEESDG